MTNNNKFSVRKRSYKTSQNLFKSFEYAFSGIKHNFNYTKNFRIQLFCGIFTLGFSFLLKCDITQLMILFATVISVLILEILNTSIESIVDLIADKKFYKLAKIAKDCSAASVLLASINSFFVALYIFFPKISLLFQS